MAYLVCFGLSIFFAYLSLKETNRYRKFAFLIISAALPIILAGLRDFSIGIDVENYRINKIQYWPSAVSSDSVWEYMASNDWAEPLFSLFMGIIAQTTGCFRLFLLLSHTAIIAGVYVGAMRLKKHADPALVIALFYLIFFNHSLNIIRQYMAMALIFAFLKDIEEKRFIRYSVVVLIASLIHSTALLAFGALVIYGILYGKYTVGGYKIGKFTLGKKHDLSPKQRQLLIIITLGLGVLLFEPMCRLLITLGILGEKYMFYIVSETRSYAGIVSIFLVWELLMAYLLRRRLKKSDSLSGFYLVVSVCYLILQQLTAFIVFGKRIAAYFSLQNLVTVGIIDHSLRNCDKRIRLASKITIITLALMYWFAFYYVRNASQTMPYQWCF